jgi:hypothetical protein
MIKKRVIIILVSGIYAVALSVSALPNAVSVKLFSALFTGVAHAEEALKAGMVDPRTGKKIKYWVAPMDPTYIRNEPGQSPMGMDLVPVYEEEGGEKEPSSTVRIDPVTRQNMGIRLGRVEKRQLSKRFVPSEQSPMMKPACTRSTPNSTAGSKPSTSIFWGKRWKKGSRCSISTAPICSRPSRNI